MIYGNNTLDFFYDSNGTAYALKYNSTVCYYVTNLQGDVIRIVDASENTAASYTYDPYGKILTATGTTERILVSTEVKTYTYFYTGGSLMQETIETVTTTDDGSTTSTQTLNYAYDASGTPMSVTYGGATYYYALNLQGDVMAILNTSGTAVVTYTYDAWGNILETLGTMAATLGKTNALTYRGYVYDNETELYYLQSRYYDPEQGRFINSDVLVATGQGLLGNNMFAYCRSNPVSRVDSAGATDETADKINIDEQDSDDDLFGGPRGGGNNSTSSGLTSGGASQQGIAKPSVPQLAWDILEYLKSHSWHPMNGYKGGRVFANDGRDGS